MNPKFYTLWLFKSSSTVWIRAQWLVLLLMLLATLAGCSSNPDNSVYRQLQNKLAATETELQRERLEKHIFVVVGAFASGMCLVLWINPRRQPIAPGTTVSTGHTAPGDRTNLNGQSSELNKANTDTFHSKATRSWVIDGTSIGLDTVSGTLDLRKVLSLVTELKRRGYHFKVIFDLADRSRIERNGRVDHQIYQRLLNELPAFFQAVPDRHVYLLRASEMFGSSILSSDLADKNVVQVKVERSSLRIDRLGLSIPIAKSLEASATNLFRDWDKKSSANRRQSTTRNFSGDGQSKTTRNAQYQEAL